MSEWSVLLRDPRWQRMRLKVFERDDWTCIHCDDSDSTLHVHHKNAYRHGLMPWEYGMDELQTLCERCHTKLKGLIPGSVQLFEGLGIAYSTCPKCGGNNWKNKGSYEKCMCRNCDFSTCQIQGY